MPQEMIDALKYIPQRPPMVMIDSLVSCDPVTTVGRLVVKEDCIFVENGRMTGSGLMEFIAQTCAARIGYLGGGVIKIGVIGGVKDFRVHGAPKVGDELISTIVVDSQVFDAVIINAEVRCGEALMASCNMKVFVIDEPYAGTR